MKTLRDLECDYLEALPLRDRCAYLAKEYGKEIANEGDWFYYCSDYVINIHDYNEDGVFSAVAHPVKDNGNFDYSKIIAINTFTEEELTA